MRALGSLLCAAAAWAPLLEVIVDGASLRLASDLSRCLCLVDQEATVAIAMKYFCELAHMLCTANHLHEVQSHRSIPRPQWSDKASATAAHWRARALRFLEPFLHRGSFQQDACFRMRTKYHKRNRFKQPLVVFACHVDYVSMFR